MDDAPSSPRSRNAAESVDARVDELLAVIPDIVVTLSPDGRLLTCSAASGRLLGYAPEELVGHALGQLAPLGPDGAALAAAELRAVLTGERTNAILIPLRHRDGSERWFEVRSGVGREPDGSTVVRAILRDTTERLNAERRLRAIIDQTNDIIVVMGVDGVIQFENRAVERVLGFAPGERIGRSVLQYVHPDDLAAAEAGLEKATALGASTSLTCRFRHKDGSWRHLETHGTNMAHDPAIGGILGVARDVSERMRLQERLESAERLDSIGRLAGGIAHDFNNLLAVILSASEELRAERRVDLASQRSLGLIVDAAERARDLTSKLLTFARRQPADAHAAVDVAEALFGAEALLRRLLGPGCTLRLQLSGASLAVPLAPPQLEQVFLNLTANARDAMPDGGSLSIELSLIDRWSPEVADLDLATTGSVVRLSFQDTGLGMAPDVAARAFEPFYSTKEHGKGTGLGLSMVYGIVRGCGGDLRITSQPGRGTRVELLLPQAPMVLAAASTVAPKTVRGGAETVLVVEDNDDVRNLTKRTLTQVGYHVVEASGGPQALEMLASGTTVDLVVTDVVMPQMNGVTMAKEIRKRRTAMPVLFITGYTPEHVLERQALDARTALLTKPFKRDALLQHVRDMLDVTAV